MQVISRSKVPFVDLAFTPYTESQGQGLFYKKYNHDTLRLRDSVNSIKPTFNPLTVRGSNKTLFHNYNLITLIMLHTYQIHPPRDW